MKKKPKSRAPDRKYHRTACRDKFHVPANASWPDTIYAPIIMGRDTLLREVLEDLAVIADYDLNDIDLSDVGIIGISGYICAEPLNRSDAIRCIIEILDACGFGHLKSQFLPPKVIL